MFEENEIDLKDYKERKKARTLELDELQKLFQTLKDSSKEDEAKVLTTNIELLEKFLSNWQQLSDEELNEGLMTFIEKIVWYYPKGSEEQPGMGFYWKE